MTTGQRGMHKSVTIKRSFRASERQKAKMHEAAQMQLFQMSDVKGGLHKKQQAASKKQHAAVSEWRRVCAEAPDQPLIRCRARSRMTKEITAPIQGKTHSKELPEEHRISNGEFDDLMVLANLAEELESEGQYHTERSLHIQHGDGDVEAGEHALRVKGRVRLTQIKRQARLPRLQSIQKKQSQRHEHAHLTDSTSLGLAQVRAERHGLDVPFPQECGYTRRNYMGQSLSLVQMLEEPKDHHYTARARDRRRLRIIKRRRQCCDAPFQSHELLNLTVTNNDIGVTADRVQEASGPHNVQDPCVFLESGFKVTEDTTKKASPVKLFKIINERLQVPLVESHAILPESPQMIKEPKDIIEQECDALRRTQDSFEEPTNINDEGPQQPSVEPHEIISETVQMTKECEEPEEQQSDTHRLTQASVVEPVKPHATISEPTEITKDLGENREKQRDAHRVTGVPFMEPLIIKNNELHQPSVEPHASISDPTEINDLEKPMEQQSDACQLGQASVKENVEPQATIPKPTEIIEDLGGLREKQSDADRVTRASYTELLRTNNEDSQQLSVEPQVVIPEPLEITKDLGELREKQSDAHQVTGVSFMEPSLINNEESHQTSVVPHAPIDDETEINDLGKPMEQQSDAHQLKDVPLVSLLHEYGYARPNHSGQPLSLVQMLDEPKDSHYVARQRRRLRIFKRRKQRYDAQFRKMVVQTREMYDAHRWWLSHTINARNEEKAREQSPVSTFHVEYEQQCESMQQRRQHENEEQIPSKNVNPQLNRPHLMEESNKEGPQNLNAEQDTGPVEVNHSFQYLTFAKPYEGADPRHLVSDQFARVQQQTTDVEHKEKTPHLNGHVRLTQLKRKARSQNSDASDTQKEKSESPAVDVGDRSPHATNNNQGGPQDSNNQGGSSHARGASPARVTRSRVTRSSSGPSHARATRNISGPSHARVTRSSTRKNQVP